MRKLITAAILAVLGWQGYGAYQRASLASEEPSTESSEESSTESSETSASDDSPYSCDGRIYCSQMTSCDEATWFIEHCPGTKMDGGNDGVPCESQWCGR